MHYDASMWYGIALMHAELIMDDLFSDYNKS